MIIHTGAFNTYSRDHDGIFSEYYNNTCRREYTIKNVYRIWHDMATKAWFQNQSI